MSTMSAGYSGTPLTKKLGIKAGQMIVLLNAPENYNDLLAPLPDGLIRYDSLDDVPLGKVDFVQCFVENYADLEAIFPTLTQLIRKDGMIWISWYKKASKIPTDLTEDVIRDLGLTLGVVDVKVAAVDARWSALKFVYRLENR